MDKELTKEKFIKKDKKWLAYTSGFLMLFGIIIGLLFFVPQINIIALTIGTILLLAGIIFGVFAAIYNHKKIRTAMIIAIAIATPIAGFASYWDGLVLALVIIFGDSDWNWENNYQYENDLEATKEIIKTFGYTYDYLFIDYYDDDPDIYYSINRLKARAYTWGETVISNTPYALSYDGFLYENEDKITTIYDISRSRNSGSSYKDNIIKGNNSYFQSKEQFFDEYSIHFKTSDDTDYSFIEAKYSKNGKVRNSEFEFEMPITFELSIFGKTNIVEINHLSTSYYDYYKSWSVSMRGTLDNKAVSFSFSEHAHEIVPFEKAN